MPRQPRRNGTFNYTFELPRATNYNIDFNACSVYYPIEQENKMPDVERVTNEFIENYFKSEEWLARLHNNLDTCVYEKFVFNEGKEETLLAGPTHFNQNSIGSWAKTSKHFANKQWDSAFFNKCLSEFLERHGFIKVTDERLEPRVRGSFFNKALMIEATVDFKQTSAGMEEVKAKIPVIYAHSCPCCQKLRLDPDHAEVEFTGKRLTNNAFNHYWINFGAMGVELLPTPGQRFMVRDQISRYACYECTDKNHDAWFDCQGCSRLGLVAERCDVPSNRYTSRRAVCEGCFENHVRDHMYISNNLVFQPVELTSPSKMRHVGCEFECYVKPKKRIPKFDDKYIYQVKHDGSLTTQGKGVPIEVVTQPLLHWRDDAIKSICKELSNADVTVDATCGGHIHVDAGGMNMNRTNMMRVRNLFRVYEAAFFAVCSKGRLDNARYCAPVALDNQQGPVDNRYVSMNLCSVNNHGTIEFRCFDGSSDPDEWLTRIAFVEGFVNMAKESLNKMVEETDASVLSQLSTDSGLDSWNAIIDGYGFNRAGVLKEIIAKNGPALINLAACRFKLKPQVVNSLIKQHENYWKI